MCAIAFLELLGLQLSLDQSVILDSPRWWARLLWYYPVFFNLLLVCAGSAALLARRGIAEAVRDWVLHDSDAGTRRLLVAHAVLFATFYGLSVVGFHMGGAAGPVADLWFFAWLACGLLAVAAWALTLAAPALWITLLRREGRAILWGLTLGCVVWQGAEMLTGGFFSVAQRPTLLMVGGILRGLGYATMVEEGTARIVTPTFSVRMSAACFGYEGIALVLVFSSAYLFALRKELAFPRSFLLIFIAALVSWSMNVGRVVALILLGTYQGKYAIEGFHSVAGWLYFAAIAAGIVALSQHPWFANTLGQHPGVKPEKNPAAPYLLPFMALVAATMVTRIFTGSFDSLYPLRIVFVGLVLVWYRKALGQLGWRGSAWAALPGALIFVGWMALEPSPGASPISDGLALLPGWAAVTWLTFRALGSSVAIPFAEELAFRGYLMRKLTASDFESQAAERLSVFALMASSLMFGAMHGRFVAGTLAGLALALIFRRRGRLADAVVAHGTANSLIALYALTTRNWSVWS